ncbi:MAG: succinate dehydrogenase, cytochrome b556 subunit [Burkholderiales bacterium]
MTVKQRPKHLDILKIRLPLPGFVSILHRISGAGLFVFAWVLLYLLQESLRSPESYQHVQELMSYWLAKVFLTGMLWAFLHHFFAGIRFLLLDIHIGGDLRAARASSWVVLAASLALTVFLGARIW